MTLSQLINEVKNWSKKEQIELCYFISQNITIGIRSILSYPDKNEKEKLEGIMWLNEFHHRINNLRSNIEKEISKNNPIESIGKSAQLYANQNKIAKNEIAETLRHSHDSMKLKIQGRKNRGLEKSIFKLIEQEDFRLKTGMYIGENKISTLKGFIDGYFYGLDAMEIYLKESEPKFEIFNEWVADRFNWKESTAGWKNILLKECNGNEKNALA